MDGLGLRQEREEELDSDCNSSTSEKAKPARMETLTTRNEYVKATNADGFCVLEATAVR